MNAVPVDARLESIHDLMRITEAGAKKNTLPYFQQLKSLIDGLWPQLEQGDYRIRFLTRELQTISNSIPSTITQKTYLLDNIVQRVRRAANALFIALSPQNFSRPIDLHHSIYREKAKAEFDLETLQTIVEIAINENNAADFRSLMQNNSQLPLDGITVDALWNWANGKGHLDIMIYLLENYWIEPGKIGKALMGFSEECFRQIQFPIASIHFHRLSPEVQPLFLRRLESPSDPDEVLALRKTLTPHHPQGNFRVIPLPPSLMELPKVPDNLPGFPAFKESESDAPFADEIDYLKRVHSYWLGLLERHGFKMKVTPIPELSPLQTAVDIAGRVGDLIEKIPSELGALPEIIDAKRYCFDCQLRIISFLQKSAELELELSGSTTLSLTDHAKIYRSLITFISNRNLVFELPTKGTDEEKIDFIFEQAKIFPYEDFPALFNASFAWDDYKNNKGSCEEVRNQLWAGTSVANARRRDFDEKKNDDIPMIQLRNALLTRNTRTLREALFQFNPLYMGDKAQAELLNPLADAAPTDDFDPLLIFNATIPVFPGDVLFACYQRLIKQGRDDRAGYIALHPSFPKIKK
ncbi:MAG: hypothetical protein JSS32_05000 [Verrucomicrobia bacterium]|nr:hypothetical protein [Verrucomicrobiota bacterium]